MNAKNTLKELLPFCNESICKRKNQEFLSTIVDRLRNTINAHSLPRRFSDDASLNRTKYEPPTIPIEKEGVAFILPRQGFIPQSFPLGSPDEVYVPTFQISISFDWKTSYIETERYDIVHRTIGNAAKVIMEYEEECFFRVLVAAATSRVHKSGEAPPLPPPVIKQSKNHKSYGSCNLELITKMFSHMVKTGNTMTHVLLSPKDAIDLGKDVVNGKLKIKHEGDYFEVELVELKTLGVNGRYNIDGSEAPSCVFTTHDGKFNDYEVKSANIKDDLGNLVQKGETQIYGISKIPNNRGFVMVKDDVNLFEATELLQRGSHGYYGWEDVGFCIANAKTVCMGIIDRSES